MRLKETWRKNLQEFEVPNRIVDKFVFGTGGLAHERAKFELALACWMVGRHFICEGKLTFGRGIVDVCDLDEGVIFEVVDSERPESIESKKLKYPFPVVVVRV